MVTVVFNGSIINIPPVREGAEYYMDEFEYAADGLMSNYGFFKHCLIGIMADGSGVAIYNEFSGNSAFINSRCSVEENHGFFAQQQLTFDDFERWLGTGTKDVDIYLKWLVQNEFVFTL